MTSTALKCRTLRRDLLLLVVVAFVGFGVVLFTDLRSRWIFAISMIACCLITPSIRFILLYRSVIQPAGLQTPKKIQTAEAMLILAHMFRVMFVCFAPVTIISVAIEMATTGNHGFAHLIASLVSSVLFWSAAIAITWYMVKSSQRDLERLYVDSPPTT